MAFTLDAMSIYGQDTRMLDKFYHSEETLPNAMRSTSADRSPTLNPPSRCLLLALPLELRQHIYIYTLPRTYNHQSKGIIWLRGNTNLLATNSQIHDEASRFIYSTNTFLIDVLYDCVTFDYKWSSANGLFPRSRLAFPEQLGDRYVGLLRNFQVTVHIIDQYTGMIKFNYGGYGLRDGLRDQVKFLCQGLSRIPEIRCLGIHLKDDTCAMKAAPRVLEPLLELNNVKQGIVTGNIEPPFKDILHRHLNGAKKMISLSDLPSEVRLNIYRYLLPHPHLSWFVAGIGSKRRSEETLSSMLALSCTNYNFHSEVQAFMFHSLKRFRMNVYQDLTYSFTPLDYMLSRPPRHYSLPISSFYTSMYRPAMSQLRGLVISIAYIPLATQSPRYKSLEAFLETLVAALRSAPLAYLNVDYIVGPPKSPSGEGLTTDFQQLNDLMSSVLSLNLGPNNTQTSHPNSDLRRVMELSLAEFSSRVTTTPTMASPVPTSPTMIHYPSSVLQTPPILYLIAKLNPLMANIKARPDGHVGIQRRSQRNSSTEDADSRLLTENESPSWRMTSQTNLDGYLLQRARGPASPQRMDPSKGRSSSVKRRSRMVQTLFADVPI